MYEFQPPDLEEEPDDEKWERYFAEKEKNGYAVLSRDEWRARLDEAQRDAYAEGRNDEREELGKMLREEVAGIRREGQGCRDGRYDWMAQGVEAVADTLLGIDSATGRTVTPDAMASLLDEQADALRFRWLCEHPDWHFIERLCREFAADSSAEFLTELRRVIDARRFIELDPLDEHAG